MCELCVEHLSTLVNRAELAPFRDHLEADAWATATADAAVAGETAGLSPPAGNHLSSESRPSSFKPQGDPQDEPANERRLSRRRGLDFLIDTKAEFQQGRSGDGYGPGGGQDGLSSGGGGSDAAERVGLRKEPQLQRQASSLDNHGVASVVPSVGGEFQAGIGAFLLPEEEQVPIILLFIPNGEFGLS